MIRSSPNSMINSSRLLWISLLCGWMFSLPANAAVVAVTAGGSLLSIDESNGSFSTIGATGFDRLNSLAANSTGTLFSATDNADIIEGDDLLITIDPLTGMGSQAATLDFGATDPDVRSMAFRPGDDALFAINAGGQFNTQLNDLFRIDTATGVGTFIADLGLLGVQGLDFSPAGTLYGWSLQDGLITIDTTSGAVSDVNAALVGPGLQTIGFAPGGTLFGASTTALYTIDLTTGSATLVGGSFSDVRGIYAAGAGVTLTEKLYFAQFGNGRVGDVNLRSDIVLPNPSATETASGTVEFFQEDGSPFATDVEDQSIASSVDFSVGPLDSTTISTTGEGEFGTGTAVVSSDLPLGGVIRFQINAPPGVGSGIAGVPASPVVTGFITPVRRVVGGINTGVAIRNVSAQAVNLTLSLRGGNGVEVPSGSAVRSIAGNGQLVDFINGLFPNANTSNFVGSVIVTSDGMIAATALEQGVNPGEFTTLPVTPLPTQ